MFLNGLHNNKGISNFYKKKYFGPKYPISSKLRELSANNNFSLIAQQNINKTKPLETCCPGGKGFRNDFNNDLFSIASSLFTLLKIALLLFIIGTGVNDFCNEDGDSEDPKIKKMPRKKVEKQKDDDDDDGNGKKSSIFFWSSSGSKATNKEKEEKADVDQKSFWGNSKTKTKDKNEQGEGGSFFSWWAHTDDEKQDKKSKFGKAKVKKAEDTPFSPWWESSKSDQDENQTKTERERKREKEAKRKIEARKEKEAQWEIEANRKIEAKRELKAKRELEAQRELETRRKEFQKELEAKIKEEARRNKDSDKYREAQKKGDKSYGKKESSKEKQPFYYRELTDEEEQRQVLLKKYQEQIEEYQRRDNENASNLVPNLLALVVVVFTLLF